MIFIDGFNRGEFCHAYDLKVLEYNGFCGSLRFASNLRSRRGMVATFDVLMSKCDRPTIETEVASTGIFTSTTEKPTHYAPMEK